MNQSLFKSIFKIRNIWRKESIEIVFELKTENDSWRIPWKMEKENKLPRRVSIRIIFLHKNTTKRENIWLSFQTHNFGLMFIMMLLLLLFG